MKKLIDLHLHLDGSVPHQTAAFTSQEEQDRLLALLEK